MHDISKARESNAGPIYDDAMTENPRTDTQRVRLPSEAIEATWLAVDTSGVHATVVGVILGLLTPARRWVSDERLRAILSQVVAHPDSAEGSGDTNDRQTLQAAEIAVRETLSPAERLEIGLNPWVGFVIVPVFALANAGLPLS